LLFLFPRLFLKLLCFAGEGEEGMSTYVLVFGKLHRLEDKESFEAAFQQVSRTVVSKTKGIIRDELIHDTSDPSAYIMLSVWESKDAWATWQRAPIHEEQVGSMQRYWQGQGVKIYTTVFCVEKGNAEQTEQGDLVLSDQQP
jgi:heme-degrading monooxygenase HmoA